jgi:predicted O-linked N-acetylglucosamine transferase (SPINDLY family)
VLKYRGLNTGSTAQRFLQLFADRGVGQERIHLRGWTSHYEMLREYNEIDIALDPFPFSGATTTCEALWMGVPVVTLPGETFASRQSLSILTNVGATATVTHDAADYVRVASELAKDRSRLTDLRGSLRGQVMHSALCDADRFTRHMWSAIQTMAVNASE